MLSSLPTYYMSIIKQSIFGVICGMAMVQIQNVVEMKDLKVHFGGDQF
jgi:hypothetical protein